ncbi:MAG: zinc ribbon domain-containing protein [Sandaracinaceae bacterium]|nr:zinc ribbon domain-containing protein [Sandaracinaceae bacterium]
MGRVGKAFWAIWLGLGGLPLSALAEGPYEGEWREGPTVFRVQIDSWGEDCGPRPQSRELPGGRMVRIRQEGDHLFFGESRSTRNCWSENRALQVLSTSVRRGSWEILCRTPPEDPKRETGTYRVRVLGETQLELREETHYEWSLKQSKCVAMVTSVQVLERASSPVPSTSNPAPSNAPSNGIPEEGAASCVAQAPARVFIRPQNAVVAVGERVCFVARIVDEKNCPLRGGSQVSFEVEPPSRGTMRGNCFEAKEVGAATIRAQGGALMAEAFVRIESASFEGLIAKGGSTNQEGELSVDLDESAGVAAHAKSRSSAGLWLLVGVIVACAIGGGAFVWLVARKKRQDMAQKDATSGMLESTAISSSPSQPAASLICPLCRHGYPSSFSICPKDATPLVDYSEFLKQQEKPKTCPRCGATYPAPTRFCVKDGTPLH